MFKHDNGDWTKFRALPNHDEVDFHFGKGSYVPYEERMEEVYETALACLKSAQAKGVQHVIFTHGSSTSRPGNTTSRSQIRKLMRSKEATPFIVRSECIQHPSVFVAAIRPIKAP